jgi:hypothetical protein
MPSLPEDHMFIKYSVFILHCVRISPRVTAYLVHISLLERMMQFQTWATRQPRICNKQGPGAN